MGSSFRGATITAKGVYRNLLKAVNKRVAKDERKDHFMNFIRQEFRTTTVGSDNPRNLKLARDYTLYLNSVHHHKHSILQELLFSYNIAVDRSDEMKRVLGKSAASVGLRLPEVYQS